MCVCVCVFPVIFLRDFVVIICFCVLIQKSAVCFVCLSSSVLKQRPAQMHLSRLFKGNNKLHKIFNFED